MLLNNQELTNSLQLPGTTKCLVFVLWVLGCIFKMRYLIKKWSILKG